MDKNRLPKQAIHYKPKVATTCTEFGHKPTTITSIEYKQMWLQHIQRMDTNRLPK